MSSELKKQQNAERSRKSYEARKEKIAQRRKELREAKKQELEIFIKSLDLNYIREELNKNIINKQTNLIYNKTLSDLINILELENKDETYFNNYEEIKKKIDEAKQTRFKDRLLSDNSKKLLFQFILKANELNIIKYNEEVKEKYKEFYELLNIQNKINIEGKQEEETVLTFNDYLPIIKKEYGEISKQYLVASLYNIFGFRDDLQLIIIDDLEKATDKTKNYLFNDNIILNEYKTSYKYKSEIVKIPEELMILIKKYIRKEKLKINDYLFGSDRLAPYIQKFNKRLNLDITINKYRQMRVSQTEATTAEQILKLSKEMKHNTATTKIYKRNIKKNI